MILINYIQDVTHEEFAKAGTLELWLRAKPIKKWRIVNNPANNK